MVYLTEMILQVKRWYLWLKEFSLEYIPSYDNGWKVPTWWFDVSPVGDRGSSPAKSPFFLNGLQCQIWPRATKLNMIIHLVEESVLCGQLLFLGAQRAVCREPNCCLLSQKRFTRYFVKKVVSPTKLFSRRPKKEPVSLWPPKTCYINTQ